MGAAIFTIPAGMATFSDSKRAIWFPTLGFLLGIGFLSAKSFVWIGQVCGETGATSYPQAWANSIGPSTQWIPHVASLLTTLQAIVSYAIVLSTTLPQLLQALSSHVGIITVVVVSRRQALVGLMGGVLLPLCLLPSLSALAPFSFVGLLGLVYTAIVMTIRYVDGSYNSNSDATAAIPSFGNRWEWWHPAVLVLAAKLENAYMAHYQAPTMYHELLQDDDNHNHNDSKKTQFQKVVQISYLIVACLYTWMTMVGFGTFGSASTPFVLDSYSTTHDGLISASRCAIFVSLLCSFPLVFSGFRTSILTTTTMTTFGMRTTSTTSATPPSTTATIHTLWTVGLLSMITLLAYFVTDIGTLLSLGGGTYVCWLTFVFPPLMILNLSCRHNQSQWLQSERPMAIVTLVMGVILSMVGMQQFYLTHLLL